MQTTVRLGKTQEMAQPIKCLPCKDMNWISTAHVQHEYGQMPGTVLEQIPDGGTFKGTCSYLLHLRFLATRTRQCFTLLWHSPLNLIQLIHLSAQLFLCLLGMQVLCLQAFFFISKLETKVSIISSRHRPWWKAITCKPWCWPSFSYSRTTVDVSSSCYARQSWCSKNKLLCVSGLTDMARSRGKDNVFFFSWVTLHNLYVDDLF